MGNAIKHLLQTEMTLFLGKPEHSENKRNGSLMALRLLVNKYNKRGGLLGKPIQLLAVDNQSLVAGNFSAFQKAKAAGAVAFVGLHVSNDALVVADLAERDHLPLVVASATHPDISKDRKYGYPGHKSL